jgi:hypothetical protein
MALAAALRPFFGSQLTLVMTSAAWLYALSASVEAMTAAITLRITYSQNVCVAIQRETVYDSGCKHASGGVKQRKVMD